MMPQVQPDNGSFIMDEDQGSPLIQDADNSVTSSIVQVQI